MLEITDEGNIVRCDMILVKKINKVSEISLTYFSCIQAPNNNQKMGQFMSYKYNIDFDCSIVIKYQEYT